MPGRRGRGNTVGRGTATSPIEQDGSVVHDVAVPPLRGGAPPGNGATPSPGRGAANNRRRFSSFPRGRGNISALGRGAPTSPSPEGQALPGWKGRGGTIHRRGSANFPAGQRGSVSALPVGRGFTSTTSPNSGGQTAPGWKGRGGTFHRRASDSSPAGQQGSYAVLPVGRDVLSTTSPIPGCQTSSTPGRAFYQGRPSPFRSRDAGSNPPGRDVLEGLVPTPLKIISSGEAPAMPDIEMKDVQYLASYNWIEADQPTIIVPGSPRKWLTKSVPFTVPPDTGSTFIDQNGHRMKTNRLLPIFRAVDFMEKESSGPKLDWSSVDIVTDRNNLRKLLALVQGNKEDFRIDIQLAGQWTVLLHRWETRTKATSNGTGYGDAFERASTAPAPGCEHGTLAGHFRIITYDFAGLKLVLRCEVDAYYPADSEQLGGPAVNSTSSDPFNDLVGAVSSLNIGDVASSATKTSLASKDDLHIVRGGLVVPQSALIKIKSRSKTTVGNFRWKLFYPQQFIGQIPTQIIGVHEGGRFYDIKEKRLDAPELQQAARTMQEGLKKLHEILEEIHNYAMAHGKKARLSLVCKEGVLQVMQRESADSYLPSDVLDRFES